MFASMALGPAPPALISVRQWLSVLRSGGSKKTRFALIAGLESFYGIIFAVIILNEIPSIREALGGLIILSTALVSTLMSSRQES